MAHDAVQASESVLHYKYSFKFLYGPIKFGSKIHFYGRVAPEGILAITYENGTFYGRRAAGANFSV